MSLNKKPDFTDEIFERKPYLRLYFSRKLFGNTELSLAPNGSGYFLKADGRAMASSVSPVKQAERTAAEAFSENSLVILLGLGNPHIAEILNERLEEGRTFLIIERNFDAVSALWDISLKNILNVPGRHVFAGEEAEILLWNYLESLSAEKLDSVKFFRNQSDILYYKDFYREIEEKINRVFSSKMSDLLTKFEFERIWVRNTLVNTIHFHSSPVKRTRIRSLENKFSGSTAVLVSAGPSLRRQCSLLKKYRDRVFIFSCDTSMKVLQKFGIIPDGVMTLDAQNHSFFHFLGEDFSAIPLFADLVTSPRLIRSFNFLSVVHSATAKYRIDAEGNAVRETTAGTEISEKFIGPAGDLQSGGSVATSAFDALRFMGFSQVFLAGQDLAYTGREIHSTGTHHNERWLTLVSRKNSLEKINEAVVRKRNTKYVESAQGGTVLTDYVLNLYRHWFEESAKSVNFPVYNIAGAGARIMNMENISEEAAEQKFSELQSHGYYWKNFSPWQKGGKESSNAEAEEFILSEITELFLRLEEWKKEDYPSIEAEWGILKKEKKHISSLFRKTEIYIFRHSSVLTAEKKKELFLEAAEKELRLLKRAVIGALG